MLTPQELAREIAAGRFKPAYYIFGTEDYRIIEAEKYIAHHFLPDRQLATNYRKINARRTPIADLVAELSNLPMLGERQVFGISEFQFYKPTQVEKVLKLLSPPDPNRIVIFSSPSARMPKKKSAFFTKISKVTEVVECNKLTIGETSAIIRKRLQKANIAIENDALKLLAELIAGSMGAIEAEVGKLSNYKQPGETVTKEDIQAIASGYEVYNIFGLADLIIHKQADKTLNMLHHLLGQGNSPVLICSLLLTHFISLYLVKNDLPLPPQRRFLLYRYRQQASRYDSSQLEQIIRDLATTDSDLRGKTTIKPTLALEMLIVGLLGEKKAARG